MKDTPRKSDEPEMVFVCDWHPVLKDFPSVLRRHHHLLRNDAKLCKVFPRPPRVAFRRSRTIRQYVVHNDIAYKSSKASGGTVKCGRCKLCKNLSGETRIKGFSGRQFEIKGSFDCKSRNVIYAAECKKHKLIYVGQTGEKLSDRFSKHR